MLRPDPYASTPTPLAAVRTESAGRSHGAGHGTDCGQRRADCRRAVRCRSEGQRVLGSEGDPAPKLLTPAWIATFILALARDTGWHRDFILWRLSLAELLLYQQATVFLGGQYWLVEPATPALEQWGTLFDNWQKHPKRGKRQ